MQDDLGIISSEINGFGYRADDYDSSFDNASDLSFVDNTFETNGVITTSTDKDMFGFKLQGNRRFQLHATPYNVGTGDAGSNLDVQIKLYNAAQQLIGTYNPPDLLNATIDTTLDAGNYFYSVSGSSNQYTTDYASLGSYALQGTISDLSLLPLYRLKLQGAVQKNEHKLAWIIDADETVVKQTLEVATDGNHFYPLNGLTAGAHTFNYQPTATGALQYRLNIVFDNGQQYYSNIVVLRANNLSVKPRLVSNLLQGNVITVNSPSAYQYTISNTAGNIIAKGSLVQGINTISTNFLSNGLYIIRYTNQVEQYVEKFIKQ